MARIGILAVGHFHLLRRADFPEGVNSIARRSVFAHSFVFFVSLWLISD
jgi:hypothetical protein